MLSLITVLLSLLFAIGAASKLSALLSQRVILSSLLVFGSITLSSTALGSLGQLTAIPWLVVTALLNATAYGIARFFSRAHFKAEAYRSGGFSYPGHFVAILIGCLGLLVIIASTVVFFFEPANVDDLEYHYAKMLFWLRSGGLAASGLEFVDGYPQNGELVAAFVAAAHGAITLSDGFQILALPLLWCSIFRLIRYHGVSSHHALVGTVLATAFPALWSLVTNLHVDVFALACLLAATWLLFDASALSARARLFFLGAALGLLVGTKYVALPWGAIIGAAALIAPGRPRSVVELLLLVVPVIALGSERYIFNFLHTGNPLFPFTLNFLGLTTDQNPRFIATLWDEEMTRGQSDISRILMSWFSPAALARTNHEHWFGGFGIVWPLLLLSFVIALISALRAKERKLPALALLGILLFMATPAHYKVRFVLFLPAFCAVGFGRILEGMRLGVAKSILLALSLLAVLHCVRQNISLLAQDLQGRRGSTLIESCRNLGRPTPIRAISREPMLARLQAARRVNLVLGAAPEDRLLSYACLWAITPEATIRVYELAALNDALSSAAADPSGSLVIIHAQEKKSRTLDQALWSEIFEQDAISIFHSL